jgi:hypothetical protein
VLQQLMDAFRPAQVRLQDYRGTMGSVGQPGDDHHDHHAAAYFGFEAQKSYRTEHSVTGYRGYPISDHPENVRGQDLRDKLDAFYKYASHDPLVDCYDDDSCLRSADNPNVPSVYYGWLRRQYTVEFLPSGM